MTSKPRGYAPLARPLFQEETGYLARLLRQTSAAELATLMQISATKAAQVKELYKAWDDDSVAQLPAIDAFIGDIYSGLQVARWSRADRAYAQEHLLILSGLYGALRACDGIVPYRLEMGYKLPDGRSLYSYWGEKLVKVIQPESDYIINLSAVEYTKALLPFVKKPVIAPKFMTVDPKTGEPAFVTVHAKIARGAFAHWLIQQRIDSVEDMHRFKDLGYRYDSKASTPKQPVFVCQTFQGIGLSVRLARR